MRRSTIALAASLLLAGCGSDDSGDTPASAAAPATASAPPPASTAATAPRRTGTLIKLAGSDYGRILYDGRGQAIYLFTRDRFKRTRCFGECADAWPPVYTRGEPRAGRGVNVRLLGTIARNGRRQVTYAGRPLYFYAHEGRNEVRCQNVYEFRGTWLVVKASGRPVR
jgi:predicted lipoprotein with Yx(FWY)xxD motif